MKMPGSVGTKKAKAVEQLLEELGVGECIHDTCNAVFRRALAFFLIRRSQCPGDSMVFNALSRLDFQPFWECGLRNAGLQNGWKSTLRIWMRWDQKRGQIRQR